MRKNKSQKKSLIEQIFYGFIYALPVVLIFSYHPVISLGSNETMNFELSLPLLWLTFFDILVVILFFKNKLWKNVLKKWQWLLFPIFVSLSIIWSLNVLRGVLTVGILWLLYLAVFGFFELRSIFISEDFCKKWWKVFYGSALFVCGFCLIQCVLDLAGVSQDATLMCDGCTYKMFGFPHPNGFAIEPQFMGNLLIAPAIMAAWMLLQKQQSKNLGRESSRGRIFYNRSGGPAPKLQFRARSVTVVKNTSGSDFLSSKFLLCYFCILTTTLFLTFSRGAIYAFILAMMVLTIWEIWKTKKWRAMILWPVIILSFLFALNLQGIFAQVSKTDDTYATGVAKVINHFSLGIIEIPVQTNSGAVESGESSEVLESEMKNELESEPENKSENEAVFDGYVAESTDTRVRLSDSALKIWSQDFKTMTFGVGIGGAGQALYKNGLSPAPKEIVQNEYASLLLETGLAGVSLAVLVVVLVVLAIRKSENKMIIVVLMIAYSATLLFFSGLPNVLHIYLLTGFFSVFLFNSNKLFNLASGENLKK